MRADHENAKPFFFAGNDTGALLLHGFTGTPSHMRPLGERLRDAGYTVLAPLLPGHGVTLEDMARVSWHDWLACARSEYAKLRQRCSRIVVMGLSMGGALASILAEEHQVDGLVCFSPCIVMRQKTAPLAKAVALVKPYVRWPEEQRDPSGEEYDELSEYNCGYSGIPVGKAWDLFRLVLLANAGLGSIKAPLLVFQSGLDTTVDPRGAERLVDGASSKQKQLVWLERSRHLCTIGPERERLFSDTLAFMGQIGV